MHCFSRRTGGVRAVRTQPRLPRPRANSRLPHQAHPHRRDLPARRQCRRRGAHAGAAPERQAGPAGGGGQPPRCGRQHWPDGGGQGPPGDGYTLGVGAAGALSANSSLYAQMPFDPVKDLKPVSMLAAIPFVIIGHPSVAARTPARAAGAGQSAAGQAVDRPRRQRHGHAPVGRAVRPDGRREAGRGAVPRLRPGGAGRAGRPGAAGVVDLPSALQHIKAGKLTAYAVTSPQRLPMLPDVPTVSEAGLAGYDSTGWFGVVAPAGTPDPRWWHG
jgi:hypothetical protein